MSIYQLIVDDLKETGFDFRINDLDESLEVKVKEEWQEITDTLVSVIKMDMRELGYGGRKKKKPGMDALKDTYTKLAHEQRYNPIRAYFDSIRGKYEPTGSEPYKIRLLAKFFDNPDGQFGDWLFKWMTGALAKIYQGERNPMLVIVGPQQSGKSYFAQWICPLKDRFVKGSINPDQKDYKLRLAANLVWEVEELGATTRRADIEALKSFITLPFILERRSYGRYDTRKKANVSFIGTVNFDGAGFLNDPTGSTRFLSCEIQKIDFDYTICNVDDLWAEALWFYEHVPDVWKLDHKQTGRQSEINEQFETASALADVIEQFYEITHNPADFETSQDIKNKVVLRYQIHNDQAFYNELGRVLTKMGLQRRRKPYKSGEKHGNGWAGMIARDK